MATRDATSASLPPRTALSASQLTCWLAPPCLSSPWTRQWCTAVWGSRPAPAEYFPPRQSPGGQGATTDLALLRGPGGSTGYRDTTGDQTLSTLTTSPSQVKLPPTLSVLSSQLCNKLTSSIALLRSQVLGSLPEHESLKLRSIWVLGITWLDYNLASTECCFCFLFYFLIMYSFSTTISPIQPVSIETKPLIDRLMKFLRNTLPLSIYHHLISV